MFLILSRREKFIEALPSGGHVAEIGVAEGGFSQEILSRCKPAQLHLIDPWLHMAGAYERDISNVSQADMDARADGVGRLFAEQIAAGTVTIHRATSARAAGDIADGSLDWVYIDGDHTERAVAADLEAYWHKVRPDGLLVGHDYTNHPYSQAMGFGVVEAVNAFTARHGVPILALTFEQTPTYVIARDPYAEATKAFVRRLLGANLFIEIRDFPQRGFAHKNLDLRDGRPRDYLSF